MSGSKTSWNEERLQRLFERYNRHYWAGRLTRFTVAAAPALRSDCAGSPILGQCDSSKREISINIELHPSDREIRSTLLHEMCHAASPKDSTVSSSSHGYGFWYQVERLLRKRAPMSVGFPEAGGMRFLAGDAVPKRFPLARRAADRASRKYNREIERRHAALPGGLKATEIIITDEYIIDEFSNEQVLDLPWKKASMVIGLEYGLLDVGGRPRNKWARRIIAEGKKVHTRARREYLRDVRFQAAFEEKPSTMESTIDDARPNPATRDAR